MSVVIVARLARASAPPPPLAREPSVTENLCVHIHQTGPGTSTCHVIGVFPPPDGSPPRDNFYW